MELFFLLNNSWVIDNFLLDHEVLPHVLGLAIHLVWMGRGIILRLFYY